MKIINTFLLLLFLLNTTSIYASNNSTNAIIDSISLDVHNRVLVTITQSKNIVSLDAAQGISAVQLISAKPLDGLDFREYPSLVIKIEVDGFERVNSKLMDFVKGKNKKKNVAYFNSEDFSLTNFTNLKIIIEDTSLDLKKFRVDLWLFLR